MSNFNDPYTNFQPKDKLENVIRTRAEAIWSEGSASLVTFFTGSIQNSNTGKYYNDVYATSNQSSEVQFAVSYGHIAGSGSEGGSTAGETNPTKAIYSQFKQILLPAQTTQFNFHGDSGTDFKSDDIFVINVNRARYREKMDPGNWELHLTSGSNTVKLIDDSGASTNPTIGASKREFWIVTGSIANGIHTTASASAILGSGSYGLFYPETGVIILNPNILAGTSGSNWNVHDQITFNLGTSGTSNDYNHRKLFSAISGSGYFAARREEQIKTSYYFCKVHFSEYNWSQNPSYFTASNGALTNKRFDQDPQSYITTVGLYNNNNELLAVSKLSKPLLKNFEKEAMLTIKLEF